MFQLHFQMNFFAKMQALEAVFTSLSFYLFFSYLFIHSFIYFFFFTYLSTHMIFFSFLGEWVTVVFMYIKESRLYSYHLMYVSVQKTERTREGGGE